MLPVANNPDIVLPKLKVQANEVYSTLLDNTFDFETVKLAVRKHQVLLTSNDFKFPI